MVLSAPGEPDLAGAGDKDEAGHRIRVVSDLGGQRSSPNFSPAILAQMAASNRESGLATSAAAPAVDPDSVTSACGNLAASQSRHCAAACGWVRTFGPRPAACRAGQG